MRFRIRFPVSVGSRWGKVNSLHLKHFAGEAFILCCLQMAVPEGSQPREAPAPKDIPVHNKQSRKKGWERKEESGEMAQGKGQLKVFAGNAHRWGEIWSVYSCIRQLYLCA